MLVGAPPPMVSVPIVAPAPALVPIATLPSAAAVALKAPTAVEKLPPAEEAMPQAKALVVPFAEEPEPDVGAAPVVLTPHISPAAALGGSIDPATSPRTARKTKRRRLKFGCATVLHRRSNWTAEIGIAAPIPDADETMSAQKPLQNRDMRTSDVCRMP
jgi:hypothetical protein